MSSESTHITLIHCMRKLLRERSISKITVSDICKSAHIGRRTFYRYYSDKYELMNEVIFKHMYPRLDIKDTDTQWDVVEKSCKLMYDERAMFMHAYESKGQNGFWDEAVAFMVPFAMKEYPETGYLNEKSVEIVKDSIYTMMRLTEKWIKDGFPTDPHTFCQESRQAFAISSKWLYQSAMGREVEIPDKQQFEDGTW